MLCVEIGGPISIVKSFIKPYDIGILKCNLVSI